MKALSRQERQQLVRLRRHPHEAPWNSALLSRLQMASLASSVRLRRPSGRLSSYAEWSITPRGREVLEASA